MPHHVAALGLSTCDHWQQHHGKIYCGKLVEMVSKYDSDLNSTDVSFHLFSIENLSIDLEVFVCDIMIFEYLSIVSSKYILWFWTTGPPLGTYHSSDLYNITELPGILVCLIWIHYWMELELDGNVAMNLLLICHHGSRLNELLYAEFLPITHLDTANTCQGWNFRCLSQNPTLHKCKISY